MSRTKTFDDARLYEHDGLYLLQIASGRKGKWYAVTLLQSDWGFAVRLSAACGHHLAAGATSYDVLIAEDGCDHCDCLGHASTGRCRHAGAVRELLEAGKFGPASVPAVA